MNRLKTTVALAALGLWGAACTSTSSEFIDTAGMYAEFIARADGTGSTRVSATLRINGPNSLSFVDLNGGDFLEATRIHPSTSAEDSDIMTEIMAVGITTYASDFQIQDKNTGFDIAFDRSASRKVSASDNSVTIPSPFVLDWVDDPIGMTSAPEPFSRSSSTPYFVLWDPFSAPDFDPGDELTYEVTGTCIQTFQGVIDWQGGDDVLQLTGAIQDREPPNDGQSCPLRVEIRLRRTGTIDSAFAGGSFVGEQVRVLTLNSTP